MLLVTAGLLILLPVSVANAEVSISIGPTNIPRGDALGTRDITISNDLFAIAFAVDTAPPWGVARGGIIDIAIVRDKKPGYDIASLVDFMPNNWSSWPTSYQHVNIEKESVNEVIIKSVRDWGEVELETIFSIRNDDSKIHIVTSMTNKGDVLLDQLVSGYVVWTDGGYLFGVPGLPDSFSSAEDNALANWSASYDEHWVLGLHAPFAEYVAYNGRDRYLPHELAPGETRSFEAWLQIENEGTLAPLVQTEIAFSELGSGQISGYVKTTDGKPVARPAVIVLKKGRPYTWAIGSNGEYEINLLPGNYDIYATARGSTQGRSQKISVSSGSNTRLDFNDVEPPGKLKIQVLNQNTKQPMDARMTILSGYQPLIRHFGKNTFFMATMSSRYLQAQVLHLLRNHWRLMSLPSN
jgi:hypothetical protein